MFQPRIEPDTPHWEAEGPDGGKSVDFPKEHKIYSEIWREDCTLKMYAQMAG